MHFIQFDKFINWKINSYLGIDWKKIFTIKIIPQINKGWKLVVFDNYGICLNCYSYGNGIDIPCINHFNYLMNDWAQYSTYKKLTSLKVPDTFQEFKKSN